MSFLLTKFVTVTAAGSGGRSFTPRSRKRRGRLSPALSDSAEKRAAAHADTASPRSGGGADWSACPVARELFNHNSMQESISQLKLERKGFVAFALRYCPQKVAISFVINDPITS